MADSPFTQVPTAFSDAPVDPTQTSFYPENPFNLTGPPGKEGKEGKQGPIGPVGPEGPKGDTVGIPGPAGPPGSDGTPGRDGLDGAPGRDGSDGTDGQDGADGRDGRGVSQALVDPQGDLVLTYTDGSLRNAGHVVGPIGPEGPRGPSGGEEGPVSALSGFVPADYVLNTFAGDFSPSVPFTVMAQAAGSLSYAPGSTARFQTSATGLHMFNLSTGIAMAGDPIDSISFVVLDSSTRQVAGYIGPAAEAATTAPASNGNFFTTLTGLITLEEGKVYSMHIACVVGTNFVPRSLRFITNFTALSILRIF